MRNAMIESAIRMELRWNGPCPFRALIERFPQFSWNEVFAVIDRGTRDGTLALHRSAEFDYEVSARSIPESPPEQLDTVKTGVLR